MDTTTACPCCRRTLRVDPRRRGHQFRCKRCGQGYYLPRHDRIDCPTCEAELRISPAMLGERVKCNRCQTSFLAPEVGRVEAIALAGEPPREAAAVEPPTAADKLGIDGPGADPPPEAAVEVDRLRAGLAEAEADRRRLLQLDERRAASLRRVEDELARAIRELEARREALVVGEAERVELADRLLWAEAELGVIRADRDRLALALREATTARSAEARKAAEAHSRWAADRRRWRLLADQFARQSVEERRALLARLDDARATRTALAAELADVEAARVEAEAKRDALQARLGDESAARIEAERLRMGLQARLDDESAARIEAEAQRDALQARLGDESAELEEVERLRAALGDAERRADEASGERKALADRLANLEAEATDAALLRDRAVADRQELQGRFAQFRASVEERYDQAVAERDALRGQLGQIRDAARRRITELSAALEASRSNPSPVPGSSPSPPLRPGPTPPCSPVDLALEAWHQDEPVHVASLVRSSRNAAPSPSSTTAHAP